MPLEFLIPQEAHEQPSSTLPGQCAGLWASLAGVPVTGESAGWASLLMKVVAGISQCELIAEGSSILGLAGARRLLLELHTQIYSLCGPIVHHGPTADAAVTGTRVALRLYAAWCLSSELRQLDELQDPRGLNDLFEGDTARYLLKSLGEQRESWEAIFGAVPEDSDQELALDLKRAQKALVDRRRHINSLVGQLGLQPELQQIRNATHAAKTSLQPLLESFPDINSQLTTNTRLPTARAQLAAARLGFAYTWYSGDSIVLHGAWLGLTANHGHVFPAASVSAGSQADIERLYRDVIQRLAILRAYLPNAP